MPPDLQAIVAARLQLRAARKQLQGAVYDVSVKQAALDNAERIYAEGRPELATARTNRDNAVAFAASVRGFERDSRTLLASGITNWVQDIPVDTDVARMTTNAPIVLFPVRIETKFGIAGSPPGPALMVRIYPDEIFVNLHEVAITIDERDAGIAFYTARDQQPGTEPELWRQLLTKMTPERAAYVLRLLSPNFGGGSSTETGTASNSVGLEFPLDVLLKQSDFSRPAEAVLPDRWIVRTVSGTTVVDYPGRAIPEPLIMTPDPQRKEQSELFQIRGSNPPMFIDDELAWTVDYDRAVAVGMAVTIPLTATQATPVTGGFDKILVFGVKTSFDQNDTVHYLEQLFDEHHYTRGIALVPQGTATNNTEDEPTTFPVDDPTSAISFAIERNPPPVPNSSSVQNSTLAGYDSAALARVLGVHSGLFSNVAGATRIEQKSATAMATLMWPTTFGYTIEQLMTAIIQPNTHNTIQDYFIKYVRARGPAPAFRIGNVPYGVLPALSVLGWKKRGTSAAETFEVTLQDLLLRVRETWKLGAFFNLPKVTANSADPLADLFRVLALHPSGRELYKRRATGVLASLDMFNLAGFDFAAAVKEGEALVNDLLGRVALPTWIQTALAKLTHSDTSQLVAFPLVAPPDKLSETTNIASELLSGFIGATINQIWQDSVPVPEPFKKTTFYALLRNALLYTLVRRSIQVAVPPPPFDVVERQVVARATDPLPFVNLLLTVFGNTNGKAVGDFVKDNPLDPVWGPFRSALNDLILLTQKTAEIERLFTETLDLSSHRLDAWLTAFATRRLEEMRASQQQIFMAPVGSYFGGYAFVENVRPAARTTTTLPGFGTVETQPGNGGFVHAPSLSHATAAAILRNGYMSFRDEGLSKYAFDLSSARVRAAREVLEELRAGQPIGAVLGYRFERGVRETGDVSLNQYRVALRRYFPLVANKAGGSTTVPPAQVESVAARNVVDGLALWNAHQANTIPWDTATDLPRRTILVNGVSTPNPPYTALVAQINKLGDAADGIADLNVSEGIFQLIRGNVTAAAGNLDALARGLRPPDPEIAVSQRGGIPTSHRVALVFSGTGIPTGPGNGWTGTLTARAKAEPLLDNWAGTILGDPSGAKAHVTLDPVDPATGTATSVDIPLANLGLRPLDVVAIARASATANAGSLLDRRFAAAAAKFLADNNDSTHKVGAIAYLPAQGVGSVPQVMEVARALGALLGGARNLASDDLSSSTDARAARAATDPINQPLLVPLAGRVNDVKLALRDTIIPALLSQTNLAAALVAAADYFADAFPAPGSTDESLAVTIAPSIAAELKRRLDAVPPPSTPPAPPPPATAAELIEQFRTLFGNDFLVLPPFVPPAAAELDLSLAGRATLLPGANDGDAPQQFLQQAAQIYEGLGRFRLLSLYMGALGQPQLRLDVAQLPHKSGERWTGLPFAVTSPPTPPPSPGRQSLLLYSRGAAAPAASDTWQGIVIQDWVEVIPNATETNALGFHYDNPGAEAAQVVLVVPPSSLGANWTTADIWGTLSETLDLAKIRGVDLEMVGGFGQFLPAIFAPVNFENASLGFFVGDSNPQTYP